MIKEKSIPVFLFIAIFLSIFLAACSGETPEPATTPEGEVEPEATVEDNVEEAQTPEASGLTAVIVSGDSAGAGKPFSFDATQSVAGEASIVNYVWNMGDGTTLFGIAVEHAYDEPDLYTVTLTVTDEDGQIDTVAEVVEVYDLEEGATPTATGESTLVGTKWKMDNAIRGTTVTLEFEEEALSGLSGCNTYNASYTVELFNELSSGISVNLISVGSQVCTLEVMGQETGYLESLASANNYTIDGNKLILETGSGTLTFSHVPN